VTAHGKHVPERRCVGCGRVRPQAELLRIAIEPAGGVAVDVRGGRGAYVCRAAACAERAIRRGSLARALRHPIGDAEGLRDRMVAAFGD